MANRQFGYDSDSGTHSASLAYTVYGERLSLKLRLQNLLDEQIEIQQGDVVTPEQTVGVTARLDLAYRF